MNDGLFSDLQQYGDRSSSFLTAYPGFETFEAEQGQIRYMATPRAWVVGTEPLTPSELKAESFRRFGEEARRQGKRALMVPVAESLSEQLLQQGYRRLQMGAEPVFELEAYFGGVKDPIQLFPHARSMARKGAQVREIQAGELDPGLKAELEGLVGDWVERRKTVPLSFLNQVDPWRFLEKKKLFVLQFNGRALAFLCAVPIYSRNGYFFADYIRVPDSKAGTVELLFIESMRLLKEQGYREVRLGLCPLARIDAAGARSPSERRAMRLMALAFNRVRFPLDFQSVYAFKAKFKPTRWEPLYLVSAQGLGFKAMMDLARVHFPDGVLRAWWGSVTKTLPFAVPETGAQWLSRNRLTLAFGSLFLALHALRYSSPAFQRLYDAFPFSMRDFTWTGWLLGPLFHNNHYHLSGDLLSFLFFGMLLEMWRGRKVAFQVTALGLWVSNPVTWLVLAVCLEPNSPQEYLRALVETDYGSSNAVYSMVGALAAMIPQSRALLLPFVLNGVFLCLTKQSWLSLHHLVALALGYLAGTWVSQPVQKR